MSVMVVDRINHDPCLKSGDSSTELKAPEFFVNQNLTEANQL